MSRILWLSNSAWCGSGYGQQTDLFVSRIQALGHEVGMVSNYGLQGTKFEIGGMTIYPSDGGWGNSTIKTYAEDFNADYVVALCDSWVMKPDKWPDLRMAIWAPLDHYPIPPAVLGVLQHPNVQPIAMSRFGETWMQKFELDPLYVPHGVDTKLFRPQPEIKDAVRDELEIPRDAFLVGMVAANKGNPSIPRKGFPQAFQAFSDFARRHDDAWFYVHSDVTGGGGGIALDTLAFATMCPKDRVKFPPLSAWHLGVPKQAVANLYAAFDVLLSPSMGEGFGIPILEAQACGVPVICSNHSAMSELTQAGWLVDGDPWWDALQESFLYCPSIKSIERALEESYELRDNADIRIHAAEFAKEYDADLITEKYWKPALAKMAKGREVEPLGKESRQVRRARQRQRAKSAA